MRIVLEDIQSLVAYVTACRDAAHEELISNTNHSSYQFGRWVTYDDILQMLILMENPKTKTVVTTPDKKVKCSK